ncbi:MAG TPA: DUF4350 domain-containing protein [Bacillota bacterium]|nr:DUF4350 domain-containing protein [Bacillota bacterium]
MPQLFSSKKTWIWLVILLLIFALISYLARSNQPKDYPDYVTDSPAPNGVKAIYTYLKQKRDHVDTWAHNPDWLSKYSDDRLLIMIEPRLLTDTADMQAYETFMEKGGTILLLQNDPDGMFGIEAEPVTEGLTDDIFITADRDEPYEAVKQSLVRLKAEADDSVLFEDDAGVIALKRSFGNGKLIVANSPDWITNGMLLDHDHLLLILTLFEEADLKEQPNVFFDEYGHGSGQGPAFITAYPKWLLVLALQATLLAIIWLWSKGKRFGPIVVPREESVRFSDERINALAAWYLKGQGYKDALAIQADYVKLLLQERWGIPYHRTWLNIAHELGQRWHIATEDIQEFLKELTRVLQKKHIGQQEFLVWTKRIDRLREEVEKDERETDNVARNV